MYQSKQNNDNANSISKLYRIEHYHRSAIIVTFVSAIQ